MLSHNDLLMLQDGPKDTHIIVEVREVGERRTRPVFLSWSGGDVILHERPDERGQILGRFSLDDAGKERLKSYELVHPGLLQFFKMLRGKE